MLFFDSNESVSSKSSAPKISNLQNKAQKDKELFLELASQLSKQKPSETENHLLKLAQDPWTKDPFLAPAKGLRPKQETSHPKEDKQASPKVANWVYSGYLEVGSKRLAIINGVEYEEGESLYPMGYYLARIKKNQVIIGVVGQKKVITLPLAEP